MEISNFESLEMEEEPVNVSGHSNHPNDTVTHHFNSTNAKKIAFAMVLGFILYHGILRVNFSIDSCKWLLSDGRFHGPNLWQPYGCMMHKYNKIETRMCMRYITYWGGRNHIVFLGDSRIRQLYYAFIEQTSIKPIGDSVNDRKVHRNLEYRDKELKLHTEFRWCPFVNETMEQAYRDWITSDPLSQPKIIITGSASWMIKQNGASESGLESFQKNLTRLLPLVNKISQNSEVLWILQSPVVEERLVGPRKNITNDLIDLYNKAAMDILRKAESDNVRIWSSSRLVSQGELMYSEPTGDGLHLTDKALDISVQMFLNMYCNVEMRYNDGSCCSNPEPISSVQIISYTFLGMFIVIGATIYTYRTLFDNRPKFRLLIDQEEMSLSRERVFHLQRAEQSYAELADCLCRFGIIMGYFFLCDRTNFFMRENKYYTFSNFLLPIAYLFAHGLFFTEETKQTQILNREQSDEWKGWMQIVLLTYHMSGASNVLSIYMIARLLVSAYLFLSGFGHFTYFWKTGDFSMHRFWTVIFRLNLLVVSLCLCMNRPYQFYYFVPLISFWFVIIFITMSIIPRVTANSVQVAPIRYLYMVLKFVVLLAIVTILYMSEVFFKRIFLTGPWKALFSSSDDSINEWWFRWRIDRYSVPAGMIFAFLYHTAKQYNLIDDEHVRNVFSRKISIIVSFLSFLAIGIYVTFVSFCASKTECNEVHPYVMFLPICAFLILRNSFGILRTKFSAFFAWFGRISLELFVCQYHIWLAADTHGVLVLIPSYPVLNVVITSFIFICVSHEMHVLTDKLLYFAVPSDWRYLTRNLCIFALLLVSIGLKYGAFV